MVWMGTGVQVQKCLELGVAAAPAQAAQKARLRVDLNMGHSYPPLNSKG